jgi:hypothetical protein
MHTQAQCCFGVGAFKTFLLRLHNGWLKPAEGTNLPVWWKQSGESAEVGRLLMNIDYFKPTT